MAKSLTSKASRRTTAGKTLTRATTAATTKPAPTKVLTVVARNPALPPPLTDVELHDSNGDGQIGDVLERLKKRTKTHELRRAASVPELAKVLIDYQAVHGAPAVIQVIGHGDAGIIWLGKGAWGSPPANGKHYFLDSNHATYGALRGCIPSTCTVLLFGCSVGEAVPEMSGDGPILLFDIAHTYGCQVRAPVDPVYRGDLDRWGRFRNDKRHREMLSTVNRDVLTVGKSLRRPKSKGPPPRAEFITLLRSSCRFGHVLQDVDLREPYVPEDGEGPPVTAALLQSIAIDLSRAIGGEAIEEPILAAPGFVFEIKEGQVPGKAEVLANGAFIRLTTGNARPRVFHTRDEVQFRAIIERLAIALRLLPR